jgi:hypothetical protein
MENDELKLHSLLVGHNFSHKYFSYLHILKIGSCDQDRIGAMHTNGHFFDGIFNWYLPGITQFFNKKNEQSSCCVKPWGWALPDLGLYSTLLHGVLILVKVLSLGLYLSLIFIKKIFLYHENIFKYVLKCAIIGSSSTVVNFKHHDLDIYKILF